MFYLVGSRFYGLHHEDSDWDYVAGDTPENRELCERLGLKRVDGDKDVRYHGAGMDVWLINDVERSVRARDIVAQFPYLSGLTKEQRIQLKKEVYASLAKS